MTRTIACIFVLGLSSSTAFAQSPAERGQKVYAEQKCSICHSVAGVGDKKGPLDDVGAKLSAEDIRKWITDAPTMSAQAKADRKPAMKVYTLPKDDVDALVAYLQTLKK